jgi:phosphonate transport system substrate-binding protein
MVVLMLMMSVAAFSVTCTLPGTAAAEIKLGILPRLSATGLSAMFTPLADYLSQETGEKVTIVIPKDFDAFKAEAKAGHFDLGFANSLIYVQLKKDMALDPLAVAAEQKGGTKFRGIIIARKDSGIEKVQDLKGKKLIFVEKDSAAGYVFQMLTLSKAGLNVQKDFTILPFAKTHDNVAMAVFNKAADAGGIREDDLEKMKDKVDLSQIKVVAFTDYYPNWPFFATPNLDKGKAAKIKAALLKLKPGDPQSIKVVDAAKLVGFAPVSDKEYDQLRTAAQLVGVH